MKSPLSIFVVWHPQFGRGEEYSNKIFSVFNRDVTDPLSRGMGIPVFLRYLEPLTDLPDDFENTVAVVLVDYKFVNAPSYEAFANHIVQNASRGTIVLPVAIDETAFNLNGAIKSLNFIRLYERDRGADYLIAALSHEIARHLHAPVRSSKRKSPPQPLKLFISHAKADGVEIAKGIKAYIESEHAFKTFFDANDITIGYDFPQEIERYVSDAAFIAVHSDKYASREWCRREVLLAKQYNRPIIILSCLKDGESRSFPYMANVRTIHFQMLDNQVWPRLLSAAMQETLRIKFQELWLRYRADKSKVKISAGSVSAYPPELVTVLKRKKTLGKTFIYPDPPLGSEELQVLAQFDPKIRYLTPSCFGPNPHMRKGNSKALTIGLSISECEEMGHMGMGHAHLQDTMIEVARHLLSMGFNLAYGGDPNYRHDFNFTDLLLQLALTYRTEHAASARIFIYSPFPVYTRITDLKVAELKNIASIVKVTPREFKPWEEMKFDTSPGDKKEYLNKLFAAEDPESKMTWAKGLTSMREEMAKKIHARIVMGGKLSEFKGKYPGILEETLTTLAVGKRVFLIESMGGCAQMIGKLLRGDRKSSGVEQLKVRQAEFAAYYNSRVPNGEGIDYDGLTQKLVKERKYLKVFDANETDEMLGELVRQVK